MARIDRSKARGLTRGAQIGFGVLLAGAAAVAYVGLPAVRQPTEKELTPPAPPALTTEVRQAHGEAEPGGVSARLLKVSNHPQAPSATSSSAPDEKVETSPPPAGPRSDPKYLGMANVGSMRLALLSADGKQRFAKVGTRLGGDEVVGVEGDAITLRGEGGERRIALESRTGESVTRLRASPATPGPASVVPGAQAGAVPPHPQVIMAKNEGGIELPKGSEAWTPEYRRMFLEETARLRAQGDFPNPEAAFEKTRAILESQGVLPENAEKLMKERENERRLKNPK